ncbi:MAG: SGNH/GDSL hydrolase family protein [Phycisphaerae bacterium]|nr:SGNH/GDSL hydrolase family protein [Phycisphaerae bacterium]
MKKHLWFSLLAVVISVLPVAAEEYEVLPADPCLATYKALKAPPSEGLLLKQGDRLAICGDSITEQKMYARIMETYLTVCVPQLEVTVRQHGWSGEKAPGLERRLANDVLRFKPTIATTCYAMNDHNYQPYQDEYGRVYREASLAIIRAFKEQGVRVVQGAAGPVGKMPAWVQRAKGTVDDLNHSLLEFRNIDVTLAREEHVAFADCFLPMLEAGFEAKRRYGADYMISGKDGVHPGWAGHLVMAYAFLKAMGLDGDIGTITVDLAARQATASAGHRVLSAGASGVEIESSRYPFCATGPIDQDSSLRSGMSLVPFNEELNRLMLVVKNAPAGRYRVTWGAGSKSYSAEQLARGVNLAADFETNPSSEAFARVDEAVAKKQAYETRQMKSMMHGQAGRDDMEGTVAQTEAEREPLVAAVKAAFVPVRHTIRIEAE